MSFVQIINSKLVSSPLGDLMRPLALRISSFFYNNRNSVVVANFTPTTFNVSSPTRTGIALRKGFQSQTSSGAVINESSDTESADNKSSTKKMEFKFTFKKSKDQGKPAEGKVVSKDNEDPAEVQLNPPSVAPPKDEGVVYAELDLKNVEAAPTRTHHVKPEDDKTEYAEIIPPSKSKK